MITCISTSISVDITEIHIHCLGSLLGTGNKEAYEIRFLSLKSFHSSREDRELANNQNTMVLCTQYTFCIMEEGASSHLEDSAEAAPFDWHFEG